MESLGEQEEENEIEETGSFIEKVKKIHARKGMPPTQIQLDNLAKGRAVRQQRAIDRIEEEAKNVVLKKPELVRAVAQSAPQAPDDKPPKPKKKANKQVIVFQDDSSSDEEAQQIIIRRKKHKPKQPIIQYESSSDDDEPPAPPPHQRKIVFRKY